MPETKTPAAAAPTDQGPGTTEGAKPTTKPATKPDAPSEPSGELVKPDDPRAAGELDAMLAQIVGEEPSAQEILAAITGAEDMPEATAQQSQAGIVARILAASTLDAILDQGEPLKAEELAEVPLEVTGVRWMRSTYEEGPNVYAVMDAVRADNEERMKVTCGGVNVMTQLLKLQVGQLFPVRVKIVKATRPTKSGFYPYWLQPA